MTEYLQAPTPEVSAKLAGQKISGGESRSSPPMNYLAHFAAMYIASLVS